MLSAARGVHRRLPRQRKRPSENWRVGLLGQADALAGSLAYGMRRRVEIARALACEPTFLLLDEPAAGLNPVETRELMTLLAEVRKERGIGIVLVEHDLMFVMELCERILVLDQGRLIADGTPAEVQSHPGCHRRLSGQPRRAAKSLNNKKLFASAEHQQYVELRWELTHG